MKRYRLQFQDEFLPAMRAGQKTATIRRSTVPFGPGDTVAAVTTRFSKFDEAPLFLKIKNVTRMFWKEVSSEHLSQTGVTAEWYRARYGDRLNDFTEVTYIEFEVVA